MQKTKKKLLLSVMALILCFAMLLGSTFAWFTDSATSADNVITTGNFDIEMYWSETLLPADSTAWTKVEGDPIFTHDKWEPGYTDVKYVKISNLGNLALQWRLNIEAQGELTELADVIDVYYVNNVSSTIASLDGLTNNGTLSDVVNHKTNVSGVLLPVGEVDPNYTTGDAILAIALHMQEDAGNKYRNMSAIDGEGFTVSLTAAQFSYETDAFGTPDYDLNAEWPAEKINFAASAAINRSSLVYGALANEVVIGTFDGISATIPANVKIADDATKLALSVKAVETDANITLGEGEDARSMDVHIEGIAAGNTVPMTVNLGPVFKKGLADTEVKFSEGSACCIVKASNGYPGKYETGYEITVPADLDAEVYVAGAKLADGKLLSAGGRVLGVTATAENLKAAVEKAYKEAEKVTFANAYNRSDIGKKALDILAK